MTFRETLRTILKNAPYQFRAGDPHVHLYDVLAVIQAKKAGTYPQVANDHDKIRNIRHQFGLTENGLSVESRLYQNVARILQKVAPNSIGNIDKDGTIWLDSDVEYKPADNIHRLTPEGRELLGGMFYLAGIGDLIGSVDNSIDMGNIDSGIKSLIDAAALLPNEKSVIEAVEKGQEIKKAAMSQEKSPEKSGCFIATAVYGDIMAPEVVCLRQYRDKILTLTTTGRAFIKLYYFVSPPLAAIVGKSRVLKIVIRTIILKPVVTKLKRYQKPLAVK